jgi:SAM-dependent methyltransferase
LSSVERGYDLLAPKFDRTPYRTPDALLAAVAAQVGPPGSVRDALDVCCGTGAAVRFLRPLCRERVVGLDLSAGMLDEARRRHADDPGDAALDFVKGDALALPFDRDFDLAVSFGAFGHIEEGDEGRLVAGIARALRPGGRFVFVTGEAPRGVVAAGAARAGLQRRDAGAQRRVAAALRDVLPDLPATAGAGAAGGRGAAGGGAPRGAASPV